MIWESPNNPRRGKEKNELFSQFYGCGNVVYEQLRD